MQIFNRFTKKIKIQGVTYYDDIGGFGRLPNNIGKTVSQGVLDMAKRSVGGRIRFRTDSKKFLVRITVDDVRVDEGMPIEAASGCDVYFGIGKSAQFVGMIAPTEYGQKTFSAEFETTGKMTNVTINLSRNETVTDFEIEIEDDARILPPTQYVAKRPIVFYGSSITEGGISSRPGNAYTSMVSRWLHINHINLGFSGNAKGETAMAEYIANLPSRLFVMDYDHNEYVAEDLAKKHENFFNIVRKARPKLPIILMTRPDCRSVPELAAQTREIILNTYNNAIAKGDKNVYFVDGEEFFENAPSIPEECTVDGCHPNDAGFLGMAETLYPIMKKILFDS